MRSAPSAKGTWRRRRCFVCGELMSFLAGSILQCPDCEVTENAAVSSRVIPSRRPDFFVWGDDMQQVFYIDHGKCHVPSPG